MRSPASAAANGPTRGTAGRGARPLAAFAAPPPPTALTACARNEAASREMRHFYQFLRSFHARRPWGSDCEVENRTLKHCASPAPAAAQAPGAIRIARRLIRAVNSAEVTAAAAEYAQKEDGSGGARREKAHML